MRPESCALPAGAEPLDLLRLGATELGLELSGATLQRLIDYVALLVKWNAVYNLTAVRDPGDILVQHLLDVLAVIPSIRRHHSIDRASVADIGSGAGIPGIPLAIIHPGAQVLLVDPVGKKSAFQRQACAELALTNVEVCNGRAEALTRPTDLVICRAFASLADFVKATAGLVGPDTLLVAMKGQRAECERERAALPADYAVTIEPVQVPFLAAQRHLVLIRRSSGIRG
jgi:16S rRNA (guanine527-N7)-methyltransferase